MNIERDYLFPTEPWRFRPAGEANTVMVENKAGWVFVLRINGEMTAAIQERVAGRIVACVNACASFSDNDLSHGPAIPLSVFSGVVNQREEVCAAASLAYAALRARRAGSGVNAQETDALFALARVLGVPATEAGGFPSAPVRVSDRIARLEAALRPLLAFAEECLAEHVMASTLEDGSFRDPADLAGAERIGAWILSAHAALEVVP